MKITKMVFMTVFLISISQQTLAKEYLEIQKVTKDIYAIVGELGQRSKDNLGNNATFGFVVTNEGVVLIDSGGCYEGAKAIDLIIKSTTDKPVVKVINTGGQDHRWLGNGYFSERGAEIIASNASVKDQKARLTDQMFILGNLVGEKAVKTTTPFFAKTTFDNKYEFKLGGVKFEVHYNSKAHSPGDSFVWLPQLGVVFAGDIVFTERMLGILEFSNSKSWVKAYESMAAFKPTHIIPGHGHATNLAKANKDTLDYLVDLRKGVADFMDAGKDISEIGKLDQSKYRYLLNSDILAGRNAQKVFTELEWE